MSDVKQVKVDNWGIYFLQRLKHFFNRTDYCDLTLQFQDNAQLKVHRLVISACTEYFELLERTCEMYEDCLVMPDDLQADVVVPIINFMYTGHLEFKLDLLERLYQTSQILNMPVLTKLLEAHRVTKPPSYSYGVHKKYPKPSMNSIMPVSQASKRSYGKAFDGKNICLKDKKVYQPSVRQDGVTSMNNRMESTSPVDIQPAKKPYREPRPTRYELPEELDTDNIFDESFSNISYDSKPLMIHPDAVKHYTPKHNRKIGVSSKLTSTSTVDIVECKKIIKDDSLFSEGIPEHSIADESDMFPPSFTETVKDSNELFDQIIEKAPSPKVSIENKDGKVGSNIDHAKIISEVLKKYPHLVKSNKNIKLKILNTPTKPTKNRRKPFTSQMDEKQMKVKQEPEDYTFETDVLDSKQAAKLIAMGAENIKGPWICLICGTPGKALHFTSYYKFRRHLVEVHNEKPLCTMCEYCGLKSLKRNYLLHHLYAQHGVPPPPPYHFPKCTKCNYIALTEGLLVKHKLTHARDPHRFSCNACNSSFATSYQLLVHIQTTGHKYSSERKPNLQCIYCSRVFLRESNLYAHLKTNHKKDSMNDGIIDDSDEETEQKPTMETLKVGKDVARHHTIKIEPSNSFHSLQTTYEVDEEDREIDVQYQIDQKGDIVISRKAVNPKQKILNSGFSGTKQKKTPVTKVAHPLECNNIMEDINTPSPPVLEDEIVVIDNNEYIMRGNELIPRSKANNDRYIISDMLDTESLQVMQPSTSIDYSHIQTVQRANIAENHQTMVIKKSGNINQPIQIVVSNAEEYKALMSSNQPIIFDNGDANKTLTVLTAPPNTMAGTSIENSQTNNMMILQDEYPMNANESVPTENPIVVVYGNLNDQKQQYQIITSGGITNQFVQPSAIITQNYENVSTTTAIMTENVMNTQVTSTWQNNIQNMSTPTSSAEIVLTNDSTHIMTEHETIINEHNENDNLVELPEVNMVTEPSPILATQECHNEEAEIQQNIMSVDHTETEQVIEEHNTLTEPPNISLLPITTDAPNVEENNVVDANLLAEQEVVANIKTSNEIIEQDKVIDEASNEIIEPENVPVFEIQQPEQVPEVISNDDQENGVDGTIAEAEDEMQVSQEIVSPIEQQEEYTSVKDEVIPNNTEVAENSEVNESIEEPEESTQLPESQAYDDIVLPENVANPPPISEKVVEKIQNLTSEWSEDEYDVAEDNETVENIAKEVSQHNVDTREVVSAVVEPEESIENIQQEVQKQMSPSIGEPVIESTGTELEESQEAEVQPLPGLLPDPQQKLSSLLNDWDDVDSQEDSSSQDNSQNGDKVENVEAPVVKNEEPSVETASNTILPKHDNISSLVNDWEEEEEEIKE